MTVHHGFNLSRPDFVTTGIDHAFEAIRKKEKAFVIHITQITRTEKRFAIDLNKGITRFFFITPVALKNLRPVHDNFTHLIGRQRGVGMRINHAGINRKYRYAQTLLLKILDRIGMRGGDRFGQTIAFHITKAGEIEQFLRNGGGHRRATARHALQAADVIVSKLRVGEEVDHHRRNTRPAGDPKARNPAAGQITIPARHDDQGRTHIDGCVHADLHASHMKHRQARQDLVVRRSPRP